MKNSGQLRFAAISVHCGGFSMLSAVGRINETNEVLYVDDKGKTQTLKFGTLPGFSMDQDALRARNPNRNDMYYEILAISDHVRWPEVVAQAWAKEYAFHDKKFQQAFELFGYLG